MLSEYITLYKTPLDTDYTNVIDFNRDDIINFTENITDIDLRMYLKNVFDNNYENIIVSSSTKGIKNSLLKCQITINKTYEEVKEYNYCILNYTFYFIEDIISQNDNPQNPSCTLMLSKDVWSNNIYELTFNSYIGGTSVRHYDRINRIENDKIIYNIYNVINNKFDYSIKNYTDERYKLLFCIYEFKEPIFREEVFKLKKISTGFMDGIDIEGIVDIIFSKYNKNLLYLPIALLDTLNNEFIDCTLYSDSYSVGGRIINSYYYNISKYFSIPVLNELLPYTARIHLSYNSPFEYKFYEYDEEQPEVYYPHFIFSHPLCRITTNFDDKDFEYPAFILPSSIKYNNNVYNITEEELKKVATPTINKIVNNGIEYNIDLYSALSIPSSKSDLLLNDIEPQEFNYPFNFISLSINEFQYPLVSSKNDNKNFKIIKDYRGFQNRVIVKDENGVILSPQGFFMNTNGTLSFSVDALDDYLIRNGSQEKTAQVITKLSSSFSAGSTFANSVASVLGSFVTGNPVGLIQGVANLSSLPNTLSQPAFKNMQINSVHEDLSNTPNTYTVSSGENDKIFQDRLQFYIYSVDENNLNYKKLINEFKIYGYKLNSVDDISNVNNRIYYDFIKCEYIDLPLNIPNIEKNIIKNIFCNGVFKNHFNYNNNNIIFNKTFDKDVLNRERKFIFDEEYKTWLNS